MLIPSARNSRSGLGSAMIAPVSGISANSSTSRPQLCRAIRNGFQLAIARSTGASARPIMMELAIMTPALTSCRMTR